MSYGPPEPVTDMSPISDVVPPPLAYPSLRTTVLSEDQRLPASRLLENLNQGAGNVERARERFEKTVSDVRHLLNPDNLTQ